MDDNEYICKAVQLADGWECDVANYCAVASDGEYWHWACNTAKGVIYLDALACQLIRQANLVVTSGKFDNRGDPMDPIKSIVDWASHRGGLAPRTAGA